MSKFMEIIGTANYKQILNADYIKRIYTDEYNNAVIVVGENSFHIETAVPYEDVKKMLRHLDE